MKVIVTVGLIPPVTWAVSEIAEPAYTFWDAVIVRLGVPIGGGGG
jgi:hypothetical protein